MIDDKFSLDEEFHQIAQSFAILMINNSTDFVDF